jgi:hypothetical protein
MWERPGKCVIGPVAGGLDFRVRNTVAIKPSSGQSGRPPAGPKIDGESPAHWPSSVSLTPTLFVGL